MRLLVALVGLAISFAPIDDEGHFLWVNVREGNTWKIRKSSSSESNSHN